MKLKENIKGRNDTNLLMSRFLGLLKEMFMEITRNNKRTQQVYSGSANSAYVHFEVAMELYSTSSRIKQSIEKFEDEFFSSLLNSFLSL